ncbi:MAG: glycerophosphodiester phosphodiesterase [Deltaproteobacteria bacterium GWA2_54_12]|nr:MAG: glycerophosphodiester phosphodiesterase [Deltaproteobacteria bacterium GWA2_54_12]
MRTLVYAHRGSSSEAPENTRAAFDKALEYAIDGIETDVQLSRDEVAVLWHDRFLGKLGMPARHIDDFDLAELRQMDFAAHFSPDAAPQGIMTLREFLESYRRRCRLLVEIKNRAWESHARQQLKLRQTLEEIGAHEGEVIVSSFNLDSLVYAHQCAPEFSLVYNLETNQTMQDAERVLESHPFLCGLCLPIEILDAGIAGSLHAHGRIVAVYTCNSEDEIARALALGVDILISDMPHKALRMRDAYEQVA